MPSGIAHYRTLEAKTPFTLAQLETYCATLRAQNVDGDQTIDCNYQVTLSVRISEPLLTPRQLAAL